MAMLLPKWKKKKLWQLIVFFEIAEMGGKKKNYGNGVAENWRRERERERELFG